MSDRSFVHSRIPSSWVGVMSGLEASTNQLSNMQQWLSKQNNSGLCWSELLDSLSRDYPRVTANHSKLCICPLLFHVGLYRENIFLAFIYHNRSKIPTATIEKFVAKLQGYLTSIPVNAPIKIDEVDPLPAHVLIIGSDHNPIVVEPLRWSKEPISNARMNNELPLNHQHNWLEFWLKQLQTDPPTQLSDKSDWELVIEKAKSSSTNPWHSCSHTNDSVLVSDDDSCRVEPMEESHLTQHSIHEHLIATGTDMESVDLNCSLSSSMRLVPQQYLSQVQTLRESSHSGTEEQLNFSLLAECSVERLRIICTALDFPTLSETNLVPVAAAVAMLKENLPLSHAALISEHCLLDKVRGMTGSGSRQLFHAMVSLAATYPTAVIDAVVIPTLTSPSLTNGQAELVTKLLRETLQVDARSHLLRGYLRKQHSLLPQALPIVQCLIDSKLPMDMDLLEILVGSLYASSAEHSNNLKFGKLIQALVKTYSDQITGPIIGQLQQTMATHKTFLKKTVLNQLQKLQK